MKAKKLLTMGMLAMVMALSACGSKEESKKESVSESITTVAPTEDATPVETETPTKEPEVTEVPVIEATATVAPKQNEAEPKEEGITIYYGDENAVNVHISRLRNKVEDNPRTPQYVVTVWGIGYKLWDMKDE